MPKGISTKGERRVIYAGTMSVRIKGKEEDTVGREIGSLVPNTSCRSCTAANSQTSDTEVVCVSGKGCNPRNLKTKRYSC